MKVLRHKWNQFTCVMFLPVELFVHANDRPGSIIKRSRVANVHITNFGETLSTHTNFLGQSKHRITQWISRPTNYTVPNRSLIGPQLAAETTNSPYHFSDNRILLNSPSEILTKKTYHIPKSVLNQYVFLTTIKNQIYIKCMDIILLYCW